MPRENRLLAAGLVSVLAVLSTNASAETRQVTVPHGKVWGLVSLGSYDGVLCGIYPVHNVQIAVPPTHGTAQIIQHEMPLGKNTGVCAGKSFKAPVIIYKSTGNYAGPDRVKITWTSLKNVQSIDELPHSLDIEITVK